jgi:hypothetical protein
VIEHDGTNNERGTPTGSVVFRAAFRRIRSRRTPDLFDHLAAEQRLLNHVDCAEPHRVDGDTAGGEPRYDCAGHAATSKCTQDPDMSGSCRSIDAISGGRDAGTDSASVPDSAAETSWPSSLNSWPSASRLLGSSSMRSTLGTPTPFGLFPPVAVDEWESIRSRGRVTGPINSYGSLRT